MYIQTKIAYNRVAKRFVNRAGNMHTLTKYPYIAGKNHMKQLIILMLLPVFGFAQEPVWTNCVREKKYQIAFNDKVTGKTDGFVYCQNKYAFAFGDNVNKEVFEIEGYSQDTNKGGYLEEQFYNKAGNMSLEGDYFVTITHSSPAVIFIQATRNGGGYYLVKTKQIPMVKVKRRE